MTLGDNYNSAKLLHEARMVAVAMQQSVNPFIRRYGTTLLAAVKKSDVNEVLRIKTECDNAKQLKDVWDEYWLESGE